MKCVLRARGQIEQGVSRWWQWVKCVLRARGQVKRGFEVVALGEMCIEGMGVVEKGV